MMEYGSSTECLTGAHKASLVGRLLLLGFFLQRHLRNLGCHRLQLLLVDGKLGGVDCGSRAEVVHASLESLNKETELL